MFEDLNSPSTPAPPPSPIPADAGAFSSPDAALNSESSQNEEASAPIERNDNASVNEEDAGLSAWKEEMRRDFERWLASIDEIPGEEEAWLEEEETPDLYSFYQQFAAAGAEARKANRRTAEAFSQWGDALARFESELKPLRESILELKTSTSQENRLANKHCLVAIELADRLGRLAAAFHKTPKKSWWIDDQQWRAAWENQNQGVNIALGHLEAWLKKEGIERFATEGRPFDPSIMSAVAAEEDARRPHHTVIEEIAPGYRRQGELLRVAQVKVSLNKIQT